MNFAGASTVHESAETPCSLIGISDMRAVLRILVDQMSKQQASLNQVIVRVSQLEETCNKQQVLLDKLLLAKAINNNSTTASQAQESKNQVSVNSTNIASVTSSKPLVPSACFTESHPGLCSPTVLLARKVRNPLPSSEVDKRDLMSVEEFLSLHSTEIKEGKYTMSHLCRRLACECFFGKEVLTKCSPLGCGTHPGLPVAELNQLKQTLMDCFPRYWDDLSAFEAEWNKVWIGAISDLCAKLKKEHRRNCFK